MVLLRSRTSSVEDDKVELSKDADCVIVDVYTEGRSVGICVVSPCSVDWPKVELITVMLDSSVVSLDESILGVVDEKGRASLGVV